MPDLDQLRSRLDADLLRLTAEHEVPGASVAVLVDGDVATATAGVINVRTGVPVTPDTLFMIQSVTKIITATLVMQLVDDGRVGLDDPVDRHLPQFRTADREMSRRITIRHLLSHTGGFSGDLWAPTTTGPEALRRFVDDLVSNAAQLSAPGERFSYCNAGFGVLGRLVEVHRELSYEDALRRHLARPLGVEELAFDADQALAFRTAIGHVRPDVDADLRPLRNWAVMPPSNPAAGNQLAMSARGLLEIARVHLVGDRGTSTPPVLSAAAAEVMRRPQVGHPAAVGEPTSHGLGWWLEPDGIVEHGGGGPGVVAMLRMAPSHGVAAVVLTNADAGGQLVDELLRPLFADLVGISSPPALPTPPVDERVVDLRAYVGRFEDRPNRYEVSRDEAARLWLTTIPQHESLDLAARAGTVAHTSSQELRRAHDDIFVTIDAAGGATRPVEFLGRDEQGRAQAFFVGGRATPRVD
ncbi:MAG TPA: serine hydrolase domain-containing protein [Microlunatus sp.]|nr:serine hydrolase domain-containing protein [Microlunatus sp.]